MPADKSGLEPIPWPRCQYIPGSPPAPRNPRYYIGRCTYGPRRSAARGVGDHKGRVLCDKHLDAARRAAG